MLQLGISDVGILKLQKWHNIKSCFYAQEFIAAPAGFRTPQLLSSGLNFCSPGILEFDYAVIDEH